MTSLRLRMLEDMQIRNLAVNTQESYVQQVSLFARYFNRSPERLGPEQIRAYQVYLTNERKLAGNRYRQEKLERCRQLLGMASAEQTTPATEPPKDYRDRYEELTGISLRLCPVCRQGRMIRIKLPTVVCTSPTSGDTS
jgi:hypothetical protein